MEAAGSERKFCETGSGFKLNFNCFGQILRLNNFVSVFHSLWCIHGETTANFWTKKLEKSPHGEAQEDKYAVLCTQVDFI